MRNLLLSLVVVSMAAPAAAGQAQRRGRAATRGTVDLAKEIGYEQPKPDGTLSCACHELQRRVAGMRALFEAAKLDSFAESFATEAGALSSAKAELESQVGAAATLLNNAGGKSYADQERICGDGVGKVNAAWAKWQPFLDRNKLDSEYYRGVKAQNPAVPNEGDQEPGPKGRVCDKGQYWDEDRAWWAINGREGICSQESYRVKQLLAGKPGDPGHRCFVYELK